MSNKDFVWTDELVVAFTSWSLTKSPTFQGRYADIEQFKSERRQPLFTTEDGKPVYEGGECWVVEKGEDYPYKWVEVVKEGMEDGLLLFSTKAAADEYALMNKPCLSVNDIMDIFIPTPPYEEKLKKLAKTKINQ